MSLTPFDHPYLAGLLGDPDVARFLDVEAELADMLRFEAALAHAQAENDIVPYTAAAQISARCEGFEPDLDAMRRDTGRDGSVVPELVRQLRVGLHEDAQPHIHFGATNQDVIDTALVLRLKRVAHLLDDRIARLLERLDTLARAQGGRQLMAQTRMQAAKSISVADRLADWSLPLRRHRERLEAMMPRVARLQLGGRVGTGDPLGEKADPVAARLADLLGLSVGDKAWHNQRDGVVEFATWLSLVAGTLGKMGQDIALMAQDSLAEVELSPVPPPDPHQPVVYANRPAKAEVLVSLARYASVLVSSFHQAQVHELERSGAAWTLEWLAWPQIIMTAGASTRLAGELLDQVETLGYE